MLTGIDVFNLSYGFVKLTGPEVFNVIYGLSKVFQINLEVLYLKGAPFTFGEALEKNFVQKFSEAGGI